MFIKVTKKALFRTHSKYATWNTFFDQFILNSLFFKLLFDCPMANFGSLLRGQPCSPDVNHSVLHFWPEGQRESCNEVGFLSLAKCLVGFEVGSFQFLLRLNPLGHSPQKQCNSQRCRRKRSNFFIMQDTELILYLKQSNKKIHCTNKRKNVALEK